MVQHDDAALSIFALITWRQKGLKCARFQIQNSYLLLHQSFSFSGSSWGVRSERWSLNKSRLYIRSNSNAASSHVQQPPGEMQSHAHTVSTKKQDPPHSCGSSAIIIIFQISCTSLPVETLRLETRRRKYRRDKRNDMLLHHLSLRVWISESVRFHSTAIRRQTHTAWLLTCTRPTL